MLRTFERSTNNFGIRGFRRDGPLQLLIPKALVGFRNSDTLRQTHRHLPEQRTGLAICGEDLRRFRKP